MNAKSMFGRMLSVSRYGAVAAALLSCAVPLEQAQAQPLRDSAGTHEVEVLVDGRPAPRFFHAGESYVLGRMGHRYTLRVWNRSHRRVEAVVSVDGRDVVDGQPGDFRRKRGYLVPAGSFVDIDGWRLSEHQAAAFRFTTVADSYAGRTGSARHVGVIGVAIFPERFRPARPMLPMPRGESSGAGPQDRSRGAPAAEAESKAEAPSASRAPSARPGLGTQYGEAVHSPIQEVTFVRESHGHPAAILGVRYNDRGGLLALGIDVDVHDDGRFAGADDDLHLRSAADPFPVSRRRYAAPPAGWSR